MARPAPGAERSVAVLELLAAHPDERFTLSEVARRCDLNKATAHALLRALSDRGFLMRHPAEKRYSLGPLLVSIGEAARRGYTALDFVGPSLDELADTTGLWARAWRVDGDHIGVAADVGRPAGGAAGSVTLRLPLVPPVGSVWMAYADPATVEAWLARSPSAEGAAKAQQALEVIRRDGCAVVQDTPVFRELAGTAAPSVTEVSSLRAMLVEATRHPLLVTDLDGNGSLSPAEVAAPVFGWDGAVALVLSVTTASHDPLPAAQVRELTAIVMAVAGRLTTLVGGTPR